MITCCGRRCTSTLIVDILKQKRFLLRFLDAVCGDGVVVGVELETDEVAVFEDGGHGGGATAHTVVEDGLTLVGERAYEISEEFDGFLRGVLHGTFMLLLDVDDGARKFHVGIGRCHTFHALIYFTDMVATTRGWG